MTRYRVYIEAVASAAIEVEADDEDDAIDKALGEAPSANHTWPDMGDWYFPADERRLPRSDYIEELDA